MNQLTSMTTLFACCLICDGVIKESELDEMARCLAEYNGIPREAVEEAQGYALDLVRDLDNADEVGALAEQCCSDLAGLSDDMKATIVNDLMRIAVADSELHSTEIGLIADVAAQLAPPG